MTTAQNFIKREWEVVRSTYLSSGKLVSIPVRTNLIPLKVDFTPVPPDFIDDPEDLPSLLVLGESLARDRDRELVTVFGVASGTPPLAVLKTLDGASLPRALCPPALYACCGVR